MGNHIQLKVVYIEIDLGFVPNVIYLHENKTFGAYWNVVALMTRCGDLSLVNKIWGQVASIQKLWASLEQPAGALSMVLHGTRRKASLLPWPVQLTRRPVSQLSR